jgi:cytosine/adenosine deaminase-related metal-dependent hydrolase
MTDNPGARSGSAIFFDLVGTLLLRTPQGWDRHPDARRWMDLHAQYRLGVLGAFPMGGRRELQRTLEDEGLWPFLDPELVVLAADLPTPLPDRRAFAVAAALAELPPERCVYVSGSDTLRIAAAAAGMRAVAVSAGAAGPATLAPAAAPRPVEAGLLGDLGAAGGAAEPAPAATLLAGEVDEDTGPTFVLRGRVVTMDGAGTVVDDGRVLVRKGKIEGIVPAGGTLPEAFRAAPEVATGGTIYPGLIDLHNHFAYNVLPLWPITKEYGNRSQWPKARAYKSEISLPVKTLARYTEAVKALLRYVEAKALIGGTTTGQGIKTQMKGNKSLYRGAMRNVEETDDPRLPPAGTLVPDMKGRPEDVEAFRRSLDRRAAYFYHLSEGIDDAARARYLQLAENDLIAPSLVGIHSLGLRPADLKSMAAKGAKVVWSPFSNLLLYGKTLDLKAVREAGLTFALGCDWAPTGGKNLLEELKVARFEANRQQAGLSDEDLVRAVTSEAAGVVGWSQYLGSLRKGAFADLLVVEGTDGDPYAHLIDARERNVALVTVHGVARYGHAELMETLKLPGQKLEEVEIDGRRKAFNLHTPSSTLNDVTFAAARTLLREALADIPAFEQRMQDGRASLLSFGIDEPEELTLELDNEYVPTEEELMLDAEAGLFAEPPAVKVPVELDPPYVAAQPDVHWQALAAQNNLPPGLAEMLREAYA